MKFFSIDEIMCIASFREFFFLIAVLCLDFFSLNYVSTNQRAVLMVCYFLKATSCIYTPGRVESDVIPGGDDSQHIYKDACVFDYIATRELVVCRRDTRYTSSVVRPV